MKKFLVLLLAAVFALNLGYVAFAQTQGKETASPAQTEKMSKEKMGKEGKTMSEGGHKFVTKAGDMTWRASEFIGMKVENRQGEDLGKVSDLAIDPKTDRVAFAVLAYGGAAGIGEKYIAVPMRSLTLGEKEQGKEHVFMLDMSKDRLEKAPAFDKNSWPDKRKAEESYRYFGHRPYWEAGRTAERSHGSTKEKKTY